jgi:hypothetical protein
MSKAKYSDNIGHYGLAFDYYSHLPHQFVVIRCYGAPIVATLSRWRKIS